MARAFVYVILGGGVAAGYAALEFSRRGISHGELCIISEESVAPYERPALSKGYLLPEAPARLPYFHTCVGAGEQRLTPEWYKEHGIELILETTVKFANVKQKTLTTENGETISYKTLIIATGARALKLEEFGVRGSNAGMVCYLRNLNDAERLVDVMRSCVGGNAVVIGGGYIGMECTAALVKNGIQVTMVFPGAHCMARLFTQKIARFYEGYYESKGVKFIKGTVVTSFENDSEGKVMILDAQVTAVILQDGTRLPTDMVVVGIGSRANTSLFEDQLTIEKGGIKVNNLMQTSNSSVYAVGDVAAFPVKLFNGDIRRLEHVDSARKTARHAVAAIMDPRNTSDLDYLPFFYSRVFKLAWQFYGDNIGDVVHYGNFTKGKFGAYWVDKGRVVGAFLEGGAKEEFKAIARVVKLKMTVKDNDVIKGQGIDFALRACQRATPVHNWRSVAGVAVAVLMFAVAYWYGRRMF